MGTWGYGNFDGDTAADHLSALANQLIKEISDAMADPRELEPDEYWGAAVPCNVEILTLFASQHWVGAEIPAPSVVENWKTTYMAVWEQYIGELSPAPEYKLRRREVLLKTFGNLLACARREHEGC